MEEKWLVVGADARMKEIAKRLSHNERTVYYKHCTVWNEAIQQVFDSFQPTHVVLPILPLANEEQREWRNVVVYAGKLNDDWEETLKHVETHRYLEYEPFIWKNAYYTALGIAAYLLAREEIIIGKHFVVSGFGRVAKMTAKLLDALQADVTIAVRSIVQIAEAEALGYEVRKLPDVLSEDVDYLINTIPAKWLSKELVEKYPMEILDVASAPGCMIGEVKPERYTLLHALPAKYFPKDAAAILADAIEALNEGGGKC